MANQLYGTDTPAGDGTKIRQETIVRRVEFGALPNATTKSVAHGVSFNNFANITRLWAIAHDGTNVIVLPRFHATATSGARLELTGTNVVVVTTGDLSAFTVCTVFIEFLPQV